MSQLCKTHKTQNMLVYPAKTIWRTVVAYVWANGMTTQQTHGRQLCGSRDIRQTSCRKNKKNQTNPEILG